MVIETRVKGTKTAGDSHHRVNTRQRAFRSRTAPSIDRAHAIVRYTTDRNSDQYDRNSSLHTNIRIYRYLRFIYVHTYRGYSNNRRIYIYIFPLQKLLNSGFTKNCPFCVREYGLFVNYLVSSFKAIIINVWR